MHHEPTQQVNYIKTANLNTQSVAFTNCARADSQPKQWVHTLIPNSPPTEKLSIFPNIRNTSAAAEATAPKEQVPGW